MDKFICQGCGKCCKKFGPKGLPLFDFEVERLKKLAAERGLDLDIRTTEVVDGKTVLYGMFNEPCPFLGEKGCTIYDKRFLICKSFPLFSTAKFNFAKVKGIPEFMECPNFDCRKKFEEFLGNETKTIQEVEDYLKETYGECFDACVLSNKETEKIMDELMRE
ncbi:Putative zinc- or iron-chelating domain protein [uncultured archaeon]|nr:Putative zinc- or iron-chelating domain protein [uncultured archaeon]